MNEFTMHKIRTYNFHKYAVLLNNCITNLLLQNCLRMPTIEQTLSCHFLLNTFNYIYSIFDKK